MRELVFKCQVTPASKKRDISVEETIRKGGTVSLTKKRSIYFIREVHPIKSKDELNKWIGERKKDTRLNRKFFHILRKYSDKPKEDKLVCRMRGSFYVITGESAYNIVFIHAIKISRNEEI